MILMISVWVPGRATITVMLVGVGTCRATITVGVGTCRATITDLGMQTAARTF